ncbi:MAG: TolB family protein [Promethearchaeota archaeon]
MVLRVKKVRTIVEKQGGRVSWGKNNVIAHGRIGSDGYFDLGTINPDGTDPKCLTCENPKITQLQNGQPTWHPSGKYIAFQSQDPNLPRSLEFDMTMAEPAAGVHNNLWVTDSDGQNFHQLTNIKQSESTLHAHFSHDGKKLTWSQNSGIMLANFVEEPNPHLENIQELHPVEDWIETHSFSPDDSKILFTALYPVLTKKGRRNPNPNDNPLIGLMTGDYRIGTRGIREVDVETKKVDIITDPSNEWEEHAHYSPDGKYIIFGSSRGYNYGGDTMQEVLEKTKLDYWVMDSDGSDLHQLTFFNKSDHEHYREGENTVKAVDFSWSPDGKSIVACLLRGNVNKLASIVVIELIEY